MKAKNDTDKDIVLYTETVTESDFDGGKYREDKMTDMVLNNGPDVSI